MLRSNSYKKIFFSCLFKLVLFFARGVMKTYDNKRKIKTYSTITAKYANWDAIFFFKKRLEKKKQKQNF